MDWKSTGPMFHLCLGGQEIVVCQPAEIRHVVEMQEMFGAGGMGKGKGGAEPITPHPL